MWAKQKQQRSESQQGLFCGAKGYTILEVLLFMAISGLMFTVAATAVSGKQARAEFQQGINLTNDTLRQIMNEVSDGHFASRTDGSGDLVNDFTCNVSAITGVSINAGTAKQGSNKGCVFLGKIISFDTTANSYQVYTLAGRQFVGDDIASGIPTSLSQASPQEVTSLATGAQGLRWSMDLSNIWNNTTNPRSQVGAVAIIKSFASTSGSSLASGSQDVFVVPIPRANTSSVSNMITYLTTNPAPSSVDVQICLVGGSNQYGSISLGGGAVGGQGQRTTTSTQIKSGSPVGGC